MAGDSQQTRKRVLLLAAKQLEITYMHTSTGVCCNYREQCATIYVIRDLVKPD